MMTGSQLGSMDNVVGIHTFAAVLSADRISCRSFLLKLEFLHEIIITVGIVMFTVRIVMVPKLVHGERPDMVQRHHQTEHRAFSHKLDLYQRH